MIDKVLHKGIPYKIEKSTRKNKQLAVVLPNGKKVHFGDPTMPEYPGTKRGDKYCARSAGIKGKFDPKSPNFWSRKYLWNCLGPKSMDTRKEAGLQ